jgi:hypothetical protein
MFEEAALQVTAAVVVFALIAYIALCVFAAREPHR